MLQHFPWKPHVLVTICCSQDTDKEMEFYGDQICVQSNTRSGMPPPPSTEALRPSVTSKEGLDWKELCPQPHTATIMDISILTLK